MERSFEEIEGMVHNLNIADDTTPNDKGERNHPIDNHLVSLQNAILALLQATDVITAQAQSVKSLGSDTNASRGLSITEICSLHMGTRTLTQITQNLQTTVRVLKEVVEHSIITHLKSYGSQSGLVNKIFSHFDKQIKAIAKKVLDHTSDDEVLWKVAKECYHQATRHSGKLDAEDYFLPLEEACLEWPFDPDFQSEEYYDHEDRLEADEDYAITFRDQEIQRSEARERDRQSWPDFWITVLNSAPGGSVLFNTPNDLYARSFYLDRTPRYLFRVYDEDSSGRNDDSVIASMASIFKPREKGQTNFLTTDRHSATKLLHAHLTKPCFDGERSDILLSDNLMSWTSSLLFAIQYAIWRSGKGRRPPSNIRICTIDTRDFPEGQFMQDLWLLRKYHATAEDIGGETQDFFNFRLNNKSYYNGEFFSQGKLYHAGRSFVTSLDQLLDAGLLELYPEFGDAGGSEKWSKRVLELRQNWSAEQVTTDREIELALNLAHHCFAKFDSSEIASILLTFKNRKHVSLEPMGQFSKQPPEWANKPDEVCRYWTAMTALNSASLHSIFRINHFHLQDHKNLRKIFS